MLSKAKHPHLNRKARRHPAAYLRSIQKGAGAAAVLSNWLLAGLLIRAGITEAVSHDGAQV